MPNPIQAYPIASNRYLTDRESADSPRRSTIFTQRCLAFATLRGDIKTIEACQAALAETAKGSGPVTLSWQLTHPEIANQLLTSINTNHYSSDHTATIRALALTCSALKQITRLAQTCLRSTGENLAAAIASAPNIKTLIIDGHCTAEQMQAITNARQLETLIAIGSGQSFIDAFCGHAGTQPSPLALRSLNLSFSDISDIPADLQASVPELNSLALVGCSNLRTLPDQLPPQLKKLDLRNCAQIQTLPELPQWKSMELVDLRHCSSLQTLPSQLRKRLIDKRSMTEGNLLAFAESIEKGPIRIAPRLAPPPLTAAEAYQHSLSLMAATLVDEPAHNHDA